MNLYDFSVKGTDGKEVSLKDYAGKVVLVVNTATKCGLTPQYEGLQTLYDKYKEQGLVILDFPSNQFLKQAPGTDEEISTFCTVNYGTTFPRFSKIDVNGENTDPLFKWLKEEAPTDLVDESAEPFFKKIKHLTPAKEASDIQWNFGKFLIDREGKVVARFFPSYSPEKLAQNIEGLL